MTKCVSCSRTATKGLVEMLGGAGAVEPAVPTETKYAAFIGALALVGGMILISRGRANESR
ncbi:MAG: hypothetical protein K8T90_11500 [Planctomycetes bacterium]|nr:hypothetical protein [Planctomycetota bacterium]